MGIFGKLIKKLGKSEDFEVKEKCDFCEAALYASPIKILTFSFMGEEQFCSCQSCYYKATKNDMRITSTKIIKSYIEKEGIEYANDKRLKNFFGAQICQNGLWITINNFDFFTNGDFGLQMNNCKTINNSSSFADNLSRPEDNSCFWTSFVVAELTHSPIAGYLVGGSLLGSLLGTSSSEASTQSDTIKSSISLSNELNESTFDVGTNSNVIGSDDFLGGNKSWTDSGGTISIDSD